MILATIGIYAPPNFIKSIWVVNYCLIDAGTSIQTLAPTIIATAALPTTLITNNDIPIEIPTNHMQYEASIKLVHKYLSARVALVAMNPLENHSLMRFTSLPYAIPKRI